MKRLLALMLLLGGVGCKGNKEDSKVAEAASSSQFYVLREEAFSCLSITTDTPFTAEAIASANGKMGTCPAALTIGDVTTASMKVCEPYRIESDKASYTWTFYDKSKTDGTVKPRTAEEAELFCKETRPQ